MGHGGIWGGDMLAIVSYFRCVRVSRTRAPQARMRRRFGSPVSRAYAGNLLSSTRGVLWPPHVGVPRCAVCRLSGLVVGASRDYLHFIARAPSIFFSALRSRSGPWGLR